MTAVQRPRHTFTDYAAMLADPDLDAVLIAIADQFHVPAARAAVAAGKHVLVGKPLGAVTAEGVPLGDEVRGSGLGVQVGAMRRVGPGGVVWPGVLRGPGAGAGRAGGRGCGAG